MSDQSTIVLAAHGLCKTFTEGGRTLEVLRDLELAITSAERVAIVGASGSGKTTLLQLLGGLDTPTSGDVLVGGKSIARMSDVERGKLRNRALGFVYQFHHLLPEFSALENVAMPLLVRGETATESRQRAQEVLGQVGLADRLTHKPAQLSGGERQRTAIARALVTRPAAVLADEPTGNLDRRTGERVFAQLLKCNTDFGTSLIVVTHDPDLTRRTSRTLFIFMRSKRTNAHNSIGWAGSR